MIQKLLLSNLIFVCLLVLGCAKGKYEPIIILPKKIVQIEGKHAVFFPENSIKVIKAINSEDCESWNLNVNYKKIFSDGYKKLLNSMFSDVVFFNESFSENTLYKNKFKSIVYMNENIALVEFNTQRNTGVLSLKLSSVIDVSSGPKKVKNNIKSEQTWEKNIYLNCKSNNGEVRISEIAFRVLLNQAHDNIYQSIKNVIR